MLSLALFSNHLRVSRYNLNVLLETFAIIKVKITIVVFTLIIKINITTSCDWLIKRSTEYDCTKIKITPPRMPVAKP